AGDANLRRYVNNETTNATDPLGLVKVKFYVTFDSDWKTGAASAWHSTGTFLGGFIEWIPGTADSYSIVAKDIPDAWDQMKKKLNPGDKITFILFAGHGGSGIWFGKDNKTILSQTEFDQFLKDVTRSKALQVFYEMRHDQWFSDDALIELKMCYQAKGD